MRLESGRTGLVHILCFLSLFGYIFLFYYLQRHQTTPLLGVYGALFGAYFWLIQIKPNNSYHFLLGWAILFRISLLFGIPNLSDDVFRFIWDGRLLALGLDPFAKLPSEYAATGFLNGLDEQLYSQLNSPDYYTIYPPVAQFTFWIAALVFPNSDLGAAIVMKMFILLAEIGNLLLIPKLLRAYKLPSFNLFLYALNPLVVIELVGNLHHEGMMLFFVLLSIYLHQKSQLVPAALSFALSISTKLIPVIFLPLLLVREKAKRVVWFYPLVGLFVAVCFAPLLTPSLFEGLGSSFSLYFQKFEFNASIYYVVREVGYWVKGYNIIATSGKYMAAAATVGILLFTVLQRRTSNNLLELFMWVLFIYLSFATTLHPWYIITLLGFSVFTRWRFPIVWSFFIFLTYSGYGPEGFTENLWIVLLEYLAVWSYLVFELKQSNLSLPFGQVKTL